MSFNNFSISIIAQNLASSEFARVASDAGAMAAQVSSQRMAIHAENFASPEMSRVAEDAARVRSEVEGSPITVSFGPVEAPVIPSIEFPPVVVPPLPPVDTAPIQESFNEVGVSVAAMGENVHVAGSSLTEMGTHAEATGVKLTTVARAIGSVGMMGTGLITLASDFGMVDKETAKYMRTITAIVMVVSAFARMKAYLTLVTTGQTAAVAVEGATTTATAGALTLSSVAHKIYAAACSFATAAQNALNISHATFLALTGVGIGVIIGAAAAMAYFASQMNAATSGIKDFNAAAEETPTKARGIQRSGEEMYRRGVE